MKKIIIIIFAAFGFSTLTNAQSLDDYFKLASENNPGLQAKYKSFEAAIQKVTQVSSLPDPNLSFGYFVSPVETRVGPQRARFSLTQMFPWFGTLKAQDAAATLMAEAKYQEFLDSKSQLFFQVAAAYYPLEELMQLIKLEEENLQILETYKRIATTKFENGTGAMVDVLRVDLMINDSKTNLKILHAKWEPSRVAFNALLNRGPEEEVIIRDSVIFEPVSLNYRRDSLMENNPYLNKLDLQIQAYEAKVEVANRQALPKIGLGLDYVLVDKRSDMEIADNGKNVFMPMVSVSIPLYQGKYDGSKREAKLMQESFTLKKQDYINALQANYQMSTFELISQQDLINLYEKQIRETRQALDLLLTSYGTSGKEFEEVLRMQQELLKYEQLKVIAISKYQVGVAKINYLTTKNY
ncbi:TolC family protein [Flexithrix dorotheae]|uniref:TolC family protein n=1 Tax=Flexithrix dorotheae TaxID=70993 RepID=UPI00035F806E|nr:TolC family protein [Flexithrix dorotheae]